MGDPYPETCLCKNRDQVHSVNSASDGEIANGPSRINPSTP